MLLARLMIAGTTQPDHDFHDGLLFSTENGVAIAHCTWVYDRVTSKVPAQTRGSRAGRSYSDWSRWVKGSSPKVPLRLTTSMGLNIPTCGSAVLRSNGKGAHYAAAIPPPSDRFLVCDGRRTRHVSALDIQYLSAEADDHSTILTLR